MFYQRPEGVPAAGVTVGPEVFPARPCRGRSPLAHESVGVVSLFFQTWKVLERARFGLWIASLHDYLKISGQLAGPSTSSCIACF
jgi:hypothetical protein